MRKAEGRMSKEKVISAWGVRSCVTTYEVLLHEDGAVTCNCPGWIYNRLRVCKHVKSLLERAQEILDGKRSAEFIVVVDKKRNSAATVTNSRLIRIG